MIVDNKITWSSKIKGGNDCENCLKVRLVGDWEKTGHKKFLSYNKKLVIWNVTHNCNFGKLVTHNSNFEKNIGFESTNKLQK